MQESDVEGLAHGRSAEDRCFDSQKSSGGGDIGVQAAPHSRAVEENRFLRQPFRPGTGFDAHIDVNSRIAVARLRAIELFCCLSREGRTRSRANFSDHVSAISPGQSAAGRQQDRLRQVA